MNTKSTDELLKVLNSIQSVSNLEKYTDFLSENKSFTTFSEYINYHLQQSNINIATIIESAQIQRNYGYQILNGSKNPGRNKVISLCLALKLPLEDIQRALTLAKENILYAKNKRDSILIFCINKQMTVLEANQLLYAEGEELL